MHSTKHWISIFLGLIMMALGILPILGQTGVIGFDVGGVLAKVINIFAYIIAFGGLYLIIDSFHEIGSMAPTIGWITLGVGALVLALGVVQALHQWAVIGFQLPTFPPIIYYAIFVLEGILLFIAGFLD